MIAGAETLQGGIFATSRGLALLSLQFVGRREAERFAQPFGKIVRDVLRQLSLS